MMSLEDFEEAEGEAAAPIDMLESYFAAHGWSFDRQNDDEIVASVKGSWTEYELRGVWRDEDHVLQFLALEGLLDQGLKVRPMVLPDAWMEQAKPEAMYAKAGLDRAGIVSTVFQALGQKAVADVGAAG